MNASAELAGNTGDDEDLLSIKQTEINKRLKELEERVAAIEKKLSIK